MTPTDQSVLTTVIPYSTFINVHGSVSLICVRWNLLHKMRNVFDLIDVEGSCVVQVICGDAISVPPFVGALLHILKVPLPCSHWHRQVASVNTPGESLCQRAVAVPILAGMQDHRHIVQQRPSSTSVSSHCDRLPLV